MRVTTLSVLCIGLVSLFAVGCGGVEDVGGGDPQEIRLIGGGDVCGDKICGAGTYCCNPSCGVCAPLGGACLDVVCDATAKVVKGTGTQDNRIGGGGEVCGNTICGKGTYCCNASCSTCAPLGGACLDVVCDTATKKADAPESSVIIGGGTCGGVTCPKGKVCCNASCGICVSPGMSCTQQACRTAE